MNAFSVSENLYSLRFLQRF